MNLQDLRSSLCVDSKHHCRRCFLGKPTALLQCPPNTFRASNQEQRKPIAFVFDKPNDNTNFRNLPVVPIAVFDDRAGIDPRLARAPSHDRLLALCKILGLIEQDSQRLDIPQVHVTNAVKCDVSSATGMSGRITVPKWQADNCINSFLLQELEICDTRAIVFFGMNAERYVLGEETPLWVIQTRELSGRSYKIMRVPHTSPEAFNTHGKKGQAYIEPFRKLRTSIEADG